MTDHSELIARLENSAFSPASPAGKDEREAAAALREQAGEIDGWKARWASTEAALDAKNCEAHDLRIEIERLTIDRDDFGKASADNWESFKRVRAERDTLASENAGLRKDAERYRWLRDDTMADDLYEILEMIGGAEGSTLDARIDAAMEPKSKP